jgi:hypothetical protein
MPVRLGEDYCMELVLNTREGKIRGYVLDDEMENFVRIPAPSLEVTARLPDREEKLLLMPVADNATGEKVGDTSLFEGQADWLKTTRVFDAELKEVAVGSGRYSNVLFSFTGGHEGSAKK